MQTSTSTVNKWNGEHFYFTIFDLKFHLVMNL